MRARNKTMYLACWAPCGAPDMSRQLLAMGSAGWHMGASTPVWQAGGRAQCVLQRF